MNARRLLNVMVAMLSMTAVGCGRVITVPIDATPGNSSGGFGQISTLPTGTVTGRVVDARTKLGVAGVRVTLMGAGTSSQQGSTTDGSGVFTLTQVPAAKQKLSLYKPGYTYLSSNGDVIVDVLAGSTVTTPDIALTQGVDAVTNAFVAAFTGLAYPQYLAYDPSHGYLYTVDKINYAIGPITTPKELWQVQRLTTNGGSSLSFGSNLDLLLNAKSHIFQPMGMTCDSGGNVYLSDPVGLTGPENPIKKYDLQGQLTMPNLNTQSFPGVGQPFDIKTLRDGFAVINKSGNVLIYDSSEQLSKQIPVSTAVAAIATDANDSIYVIDNGSQAAVIKKYDPKSATPNQPVLYFGSLHGRGANQFENPTDLAVDNRNGDFYIVDSGNNRVVRYSSQGTYLSEFGGMGSAPGQFNHPTGIAIDKDGFVYVTDTNNNRIQKFNPSPLRQVGQTF